MSGRHSETVESKLPQQTETHANPQRRSSLEGNMSFDDPVARKWQVLGVVARTHRASIQLNLFSWDGIPNKDFDDIFGLTADEHDKLQRAIEQAHKTLGALEARNAVVKRPDADHVEIIINPFPADGAAMYDGLIKQFAEVLGPDRQAAFMAFAVNELERGLGNMGATKRTLLLSYDARANEPYQLSDIRALGPKEENKTDGGFDGRQDVAEFVGTATALIPPDFWRQ